MPTHTELAGLIWSVADLLRGDYKQSEYGKVILPLTVLRRLDSVMAPTRQAVRDRNQELHALPRPIENRAPILLRTSGVGFYNTSKLDFASVGADPERVAANLIAYLGGFSAGAREILDKYDLQTQITRLDDAGILYQVVQRFAAVDLSPEAVDNHQMGYVFEELIRRFSEISNETAGEHFTPREVIQLMVNLLLAPDADTLNLPGKVVNVLDPACGTGGMLSAAEEHIRALNPEINVRLHGQELNAESYAICRSDMLVKGQDAGGIVHGNSFSHDGHHGSTFDYMLANPPFGVEWKKVRETVQTEHQRGHAGRFGAGLPRINDGSLLFLQHMLAKMQRPGDGGSRLAIVFNGSPLFTGGAGSGESEIRRWILEHDWLEGIVALPDQLFYNTGISTYFWILTNRKRPEHKGKVVLLDARDQWAKMRKSLGEKRKRITGDQISAITDLYDQALAAAANPDHPGHAKVKVFPTTAFGYQRIAVDRPLRQRFEITDDTLAALTDARPLTTYDHREQLLTALKPLTGTTWPTRAAAQDAITTALADAALPGAAAPARNETAPGVPAAGGRTGLPAAVEKAIWKAIATADPAGELQTDRRGNPLPDPDLRDHENVPLGEDIDAYLTREVHPHVPDAWIADQKDPATGTTIRARIGYEIPFTRHFYVYQPPRPLKEIDAELKNLEAQIQKLLGEVTR